MLSVIYALCHFYCVLHVRPYAECFYAECRYAECRGTEWNCCEYGPLNIIDANFKNARNFPMPPISHFHNRASNFDQRISLRLIGAQPYYATLFTKTIQMLANVKSS
jgi:hypothetical protein